MSAQDGLYTYGLVGTPPHPLDLPGIDQQHPIYPVVARGMCVLVSRIAVNTFQRQVRNLFAARNDEAARCGIERLLRIHENVVDLLRQHGPVVPFQFGTILKDEQAACQMLQDDEEKFKTLLAKFTGKAEWGLKVYVDRQAWTRRLIRCHPQSTPLADAQLSRGMAYLRRKKIEEEATATASAQLAAIGETIFEQLGVFACEARLSRCPQTPDGKELLLSAVYLLADTQAAGFCQQGETLRGMYETRELELAISGPWSPYSFTAHWEQNPRDDL
ncbi:MAG TPA: GvpL/GvpF family gas vesicle protein [Ktedonobacteraceae bacterium]